MLNDKGIEHDFTPGYNLFHIYPIFPLPERQSSYTTEKYNGKRLNTSLNIGVIFKSTRIKNKTSMIAHMTRLFLKR